MGLIQKLIVGYFREGTFISRGNNNQKHFSIKVCAQKATHISFIDISRVVTHSFERVCNNGKFSYRCGTCPICVLSTVCSPKPLSLHPELGQLFSLEPRDKQQSNDRREPTPLVFMGATKKRGKTPGG